MLIASHTTRPSVLVIVLIFTFVAACAAEVRRFGRKRGERHFQEAQRVIGSGSHQVARARDAPEVVRTPRAYWRMLRTRPGNIFSLCAVIVFLATAWRSEGVAAGLIALLVSLIVVFPFGYLWWRRFGGM